MDQSFPFGITNIMFSVVPVIVIIGFIFVFGTVIVRSIRNAARYKQNNDSPVLTVDATVVTKRSDVSYRHSNAEIDNMNHMSSTTYYVTFQVQSGDRMEFKVKDTQYGMLVENDVGKLTFQGTRYIGFER